MFRHPPSSPRPTGLLRPHADLLLGQALAAHKAGTFDELLRRRPRLTAALARRLLPPLVAVAADALPADAATVWTLWLRATLAGLRPDGGSGLSDIAPHDWRERSAWRPLLALGCHFGFMPVAEIGAAPRSRVQESAIEQLCGLWNVGASTVYRHIDRGRRLCIEALFDAPAQGERALMRDARLQHEVHALLALADAPARRAWHARQAQRALRVDRDGRSVLWHTLQALDSAGFIDGLKRFGVELAGHADTDALVQQFSQRALDWRLRFQLNLALAGLWRVRGNGSAELQSCEAALQLANAAHDSLALGIAYGALGKFNESRDGDRAFACYQESAECLRQAGLHDDPGRVDAEVLIEHVNTLVKLAWLYVLRNDPRSKTVLDRAEASARALHAGPGGGRRPGTDLGRILAPRRRPAPRARTQAPRLAPVRTTGRSAGDPEDLRQPEPDLRRCQGFHPRHRLFAACAGHGAALHGGA